MKNRKNQYIQALVALILLVLAVFIFDLPKTSSFIIIGVILLINVLVFELFYFGNKNKK
ncbi:putative integral membrane protein [Thalassobacillus pellis]|nr:putative integral membrane protein [Thalassobacillus pellis]